MSFSESLGSGPFFFRLDGECLAKVTVLGDDLDIVVNNSRRGQRISRAPHGLEKHLPL